jgi:hypothetical protein
MGDTPYILSARDYNGTDLNGDGIGDVPYIEHTPLIRDYYPLIATISIFDAGTWKGTKYNVDVISNSKISTFSFTPESALLRFNVEDETGTTGFCRVTISSRPLYLNRDH